MPDHQPPSPTLQRSGIIVVSIVLLVAACVMLYLRFASGDASADHEQAATGHDGHADADAAVHEAVSAAAPAASVAAEPAYYPLRAHWWTPPAQDQPETRTLLRPDPSCAGNAFLGSESTMESLIAARASVRNSDDRERMFYNKDRRFFQRGGRYQSITADWDYQTPARYRVNWFSSSSPTFDGDVRAESLPLGPTDTLDAIEARELMDRIVSGNESGTTVPGGRFLAVSVAESPTTPRIEIGYMNNRPTAVEFEGGECRTLESGEAATCNCNSSRKGEHKHEH